MSERDDIDRCAHRRRVGIDDYYACPDCSATSFDDWGRVRVEAEKRSALAWLRQFRNRLNPLDRSEDGSAQPTVPVVAPTQEKP